MQELDLGSFLDVERYSRNDSAFSDLVCNMKDLRGLSCGPRTLNAAAIDHLSLLPRLLKLHLPHDSQEILQGLYLNRGNTVIRNAQPFPELQELFIRETKLSFFTSLMKHLRPLQTRELTLQVDNTFNAQDIRESLVALSKESSQCGNVHRIKFKHTRLASRPPFTANVDKQVLINGSTLHSILSFTNLIALELDILCAFDLGDSDIMSMADAWPRLRRLQLGSLMGWHIPSCITYHGFLHLLLKCPELEHLVFVFDAFSNIPSVIIPGQINKNITYLYIGNSRIGTNDCYSVGKLLAMILPNCCGLGGEWLIEQGILDSQKEWLAVQNTMKKCQSSGVATRD